jgi:hypothetical protein
MRKIEYKKQTDSIVFHTEQLLFRIFYFKGKAYGQNKPWIRTNSHDPVSFP